MNRNRIIFFLLAFVGLNCFSQTTPAIDSFRNILRIAKTDNDRVMALHNLSFEYLYSNTDSSLKIAQRGLAMAKRIGYVEGEIKCLNDLGNALSIMGNYNSALQMLFDALQKAEARGKEDEKGLCFLNLGEAYRDAGDYPQAIRYAFRSLAIDSARKDTESILYDYLNLGDYYERNNMADSALYYENKAYEINMKMNRTDLMEAIYSQLGNIHARLHNDDIALTYYKKSVAINAETGNNSYLSRTYFGMAELFQRTNKPDAAVQYFTLAYMAAQNGLYPDGMLKASTMLANLYEKKNNDSTLKYLKQSVALKDSIQSQEKIRQMQSQTFAEQQRQQEIEMEKSKAEESRKTNIQYATMALAIIIFISLFLILSHSIIVNERWISFFGVLGLLVLFEFINLLIHPTLASITHESPFLMLLALVTIASLLIPLHHRLEKWIKERMVEKNKKIRLEAARKTIEKLNVTSDNDESKT